MQLIAETVEISGGSVLSATADPEVHNVDRMVWIDAVAIDNEALDRRVHVRLFVNDERAIEIAVNMIQAVGQAQGKGTVPS